MKDGELTLDKFNIPLDNYLLGAFSQSKKVSIFYLLGPPAITRRLNEVFAVMR